MPYYRAVASAYASAASAPERIGVLLVNPLRARRKYPKIWLTESSPLEVYSQRLAIKVGAHLHASLGDQVRVGFAMMYGSPGIALAIQSLAEQNVKKLLVLRLFAQFSTSTTGSVFDRTAAVLRRWRWLPEFRFGNAYYHGARSIDAPAPLNDEDSHARVLHGIVASQLRGWTAGGAQ